MMCSNAVRTMNDAAEFAAQAKPVLEHDNVYPNAQGQSD